MPREPRKPLELSDAEDIYRAFAIVSKWWVNGIDCPVAEETTIHGGINTVEATVTLVARQDILIPEGSEILIRLPNPITE